MNKWIGRLLLLSLLSVFLITGCWDRRELESLGLVQALGLDLETKKKNIRVTTMIAIPTKLGAVGEGGGGKQDSGMLVVSIKAPSIYEAFNLMNTYVNRELTLRQNQVLVIGAAMAKAGIGKWVDNLVRFREMRRTLLIFIAQEKAGDIFKVQPQLEPSPAEYLSDLVRLSSKTAMYPRMMINHFMEPYETFAQQNYAPLIAVRPFPEGAGEPPKKDGEATGKPKQEKTSGPTALRLIGTAVFNGDRVVGSLDIYETQILQLLTNHFEETFLTIADPCQKNANIAIRLLKSGVPTKIKYRKQAGQDIFDVKINLEAELVNIQSEIDYTQPKWEALLGQKIAWATQNRVKRLIAKAQRKFQSDIFGFGVKVRNSMLTNEEWTNYRWPTKFPNALIQVRVKAAVRRVGVQFQPPELRP
jgi:spore germination protein KC